MTWTSERLARAALTAAAEPGVMLSPSPYETGFADVAGSSTELGAVGTLAELPSRGWCWHRPPGRLWLCRQSWCGN